MNIAMKAICWQNAARDFNVIQDAYRSLGPKSATPYQHLGGGSYLRRAERAQLEAYIASEQAMKCVADLLTVPRPFNADATAECERIQQEIDQADYDLSRQHRGFGSPA